MARERRYGSDWLTRAVYKRALETGKVYMVSNDKGSQWKVYILRKGRNGRMYMAHVYGHSSLWSGRYNAYHVTCIGMSRPLEIVLSIGYNLGMQEGDIRQNWTVLQ